MTAAELLAWIPTCTVAWRRLRYPDFLDSEADDWASFVRAVEALAAGKDEHGLGRMASIWSVPIEVYFAWREAQISARLGPVKRRRR